MQTRSQYLKQINNASVDLHKSADNIPHQVSSEDDIIHVPNMEKSEVSKIFSQDCEERASLIFESFYRITSVVYDIQSMVTIL